MSTNDTDADVINSLTYSVKFAVLITLEIPSIIVSLIIFIYFGYNYHTRITDHNRSLLILLIITFLQVICDIPMPMSFFHLNGLVQPATSAYCTWWTWFEFSLNTINGDLMAWISIERHLLIFHSNFLRNLQAWKRRLLHIGPLVFCIVWGPLYYLVTIIITPMCENTRFYNSLLCGLPCYLLTNWGTFDLFVDVIAPVLIIFICNLTLFIRVVYQNMMIIGRVQNNWRRQQKLAFQLGIISFIYLAVWIPLSIIQLGEIYYDPNFLLDVLDTFNFLVYIVPLILPLVCLMSMSDVVKKLKSFICRKQQTTIVPINDTNIRLNHLNNTSKISAIARF